MKKFIVFGIIILFIGSSITPTIIGIEDNNNLTDDKSNILSKETISVDNETEFYALLIGGGNYAFHPDYNNNPSMKIEVENLYEKLLISEHWKEENIKLIKGRRATFLNIIRGFRWLDKKEDENDFSMICIATHGYQLSRDKFPFDEKDGCDEILLTYFGDLYPWLLNIRDDFFNLLLSSLESKGVCVVIASCFAGGFNDTVFYNSSLENRRLTNDKWIDEVAEEITGDGRVVIMSCQEDELSYAGFLTSFTEGLAGFADVNENDFVSAEEAFEYAYEKYHTSESHPTMYDDFPGELQLTAVEFPPTKPLTPTGQVLGDTNTTYFYSTVSMDFAGDNISYGWDWDGDYIVDEWTGFIESNISVNISHSWSVEGTYNIRVMAKDEKGLLSEWSDHIVIIMCDDNIPDQKQTLTHTGSTIIYGDWGEAQSFVPSLNTLSKVDLVLFSGGSGNPKPLHVFIRDSLTGDNLAESSLVIPDMDDSSRFAWFTFDFEDLDVVPGKTYYIVCKVDDTWAFIWRGNGGNPYPLGKEYWSEDGNKWYSGSLDLAFVTWGK